MERYLTKSRFKLAIECPTKLFYTGKKEYKDTKLEDGFLMALAEGGFQVGELAKLYYPGGINIDQIDHDEALKLTQELLQNENVILFEAAFRFNNLFVRADIVIKKGNSIQLIEVKSKSYDPHSDKFIGAKGGILKEWQPYIYDIAFQKYVVINAYPGFNVVAFLCLTDKSAKSSVDGLNQMFLLYKEGHRTKVRIKEIENSFSLGNRILTEINVDEIINRIINGELLPGENFGSFKVMVDNYADNYQKDVKIKQEVLGRCKSCEYKASKEDIKQGYKSGFHECWTEALSFKDSDFEKPLVIDIWDLRKKDDLIKSGKYFMEQISREDLEGSSKPKQTKPSIGLSRIDRQYLQVEKSKNKDISNYIDIEGLRTEMSNWKYPLHFIDFETSAVAIPFNQGRRPYEQIAFQFSHHCVYENGTIEHSDEWISLERGKFPNLNFIRELKKALKKDSGSIFRYANHENSILNAIYSQLQDSLETDKDELCTWIKTITKSKKDNVEKWEGERNMIDLLEVVKKYYYSPFMEGSNSLKYVLPAILNSSDYLKEKYSKPIYGNEVKSKNYIDHSWIVIENNAAINPYKLLPSINEGYDNELLDTLIIDEDSGIADGGAAMIAYARMQFTEMSDEEFQRISKALLRYCELDTFAMVMLWEAWDQWCK